MRGTARNVTIPVAADSAREARSKFESSTPGEAKGYDRITGVEKQ